jgi:aspartyl-tRNA(Asn)/glutamyl-tRNA(Gln) amidotransferase subunit C
MAITRDDIKLLAEQAKLALTEEEQASFTQRLNEILEITKQLDEPNTAQTEPTVYVLPLRNVFREDVVRDSLTNEQVLSNAQDKEDGYFKVPRIIE